MYIPKHWTKREGECRTPRNDVWRAAVWGWGDDAAGAESVAESRLARLLERVGRGEPFPDAYAYGDRPLREEILEVIQPEGAESPGAIVTRNAYGALVLNTADLLFLDIDLPEEGLGSLVRKLFGRGKPDARTEALEKLQGRLEQSGLGSFRIYRTAAGFRAMAVDRAFDPAGDEAQALMAATGTDPAFMRLCRVQKSFRARLTPKPWRCGMPKPPGQFPRDEGAQRRFERWLEDYRRASEKFATCEFVGTVGNGAASSVNAQIVELHDAMTRCGDGLGLA